MAARSSWKGYLKLSLVSVPVKAYTASAGGGSDIQLNQLHHECHSRIQYKKTCPVHGEVPNDEIVSGYEYSKGQYVLIDTDELEKLRTENDKAINIDSFVDPKTVDPIYLTGKTYYLLPDGPVGQKPYALLQRAMIEKKRYAVAQVVFSGREQVVLLRPVENLLAMSTLSYDAQVKKPAAFEDELTKPEIAASELDLAKTLIDATTPKEFDLAKYRDMYTEKLTQLIQAKIQGEEIVAPPAQEETQVINLMEALRQSVAQAKKGAAAPKPPKKMAPSAGEAKTAKRKKKIV